MQQALKLTAMKGPATMDIFIAVDFNQRIRDLPDLLALAKPLYKSMIF